MSENQSTTPENRSRNRTLKGFLIFTYLSLSFYYSHISLIINLSFFLPILVLLHQTSVVPLNRTCQKAFFAINVDPTSFLEPALRI